MKKEAAAKEVAGYIQDYITVHLAAFKEPELGQLAFPLDISPAPKKARGAGDDENKPLKPEVEKSIWHSVIGLCLDLSQPRSTLGSSIRSRCRILAGALTDEYFLTFEDEVKKLRAEVKKGDPDTLERMLLHRRPSSKEFDRKCRELLPETYASFDAGAIAAEITGPALREFITKHAAAIPLPPKERIS